MKTKPFPVLETENLELREILVSDQDDLFAMRSIPSMHTYTDTLPDESIAQTEAYIERMRAGVEENRWMIWVIETKQEKKAIGTVGIWNIDLQRNTAELSYGIASAFQGKGFMREALEKVLDYGFQSLHFDALEAFTEEGNVPSRKLLEWFRFCAIEHVDDRSQDGTHVFHMVRYRLERNDLPQKNK